MRLQVTLDLVADASIHVIRAGQHQNAGLLVVRAPGQNVAALLPGFVRECVEGFKPGLHGALGFFQFQIENIFQ